MNRNYKIFDLKKKKKKRRRQALSLKAKLNFLIHEKKLVVVQIKHS